MPGTASEWDKNRRLLSVDGSSEPVPVQIVDAERPYDPGPSPDPLHWVRFDSGWEGWASESVLLPVEAKS